MSVGQYGTGQEYVTLIDSTGLETVLPVRQGGRVQRQSLAATTQVVTVGDNSRRQDLRTPQVIFTDQSGGMGEFQYTETDGILTFTQSDCETRYPAEITMPPPVTTLGDVSATSTGGSGTTTHFVEYMGKTNAKLLIWRRAAGPPLVYDGVSAFGAIAGPGIMLGFAKFRQYFLLVTGQAGINPGLYYSTNGTAWTGVGTNGASAICTHDNKVYVWNSVASTLQWTTDPTLSTGYATSGSTLYLLPDETVKQLIEWRNRSGGSAVYILTNRRIIWYDEDADAFVDFYNFTDQASVNVEPYGHVWRRDGNLYVALANNDPSGPNDTILWFSGTTNVTSPSIKGGLPANRQVQFRRLVGGLHWLYGFGDASPAGISGGGVLAMNDQQGFHQLYTQPVVNFSKALTGGGYNNGTLWYVAQDTLYEMAVPDTTILPSQRGGYQTTGGPYYHEYAATDGGTDNMPKQALWVTVQTRLSGRLQQGIRAGGSIVVQYLRDTDNAWTTIGTLTSADTFPAVLPIAGGYGVNFKQIKLQLGLSASNAGSAPIVTSVALAFTRRPTQRYAYQFAVDLTAGVWGQVPVAPGPNGINAAAIRTRLEGYTQPGAMVMLRFGGNSDTDTVPHGTTVGPCQLTLGGAEGPTFGPGVYSLTLTDFSPPPAG